MGSCDVSEICIPVYKIVEQRACRGNAFRAAVLRGTAMLVLVMLAGYGCTQLNDEIRNYRLN